MIKMEVRSGTSNIDEVHDSTVIMPESSYDSERGGKDIYGHRKRGELVLKLLLLVCPIF